MSLPSTHIIIQGICLQIELGILQFHVVVEHCLTALCIIFSPVTGQYILVIHHLTAFKEIAKIVKTVIIERIGIEFGSTVCKNHITACTCHLLVAVIISIVTQQGQCITLAQFHMSESLKRIAGFKEIGTITGQRSSFMAKADMAVQNLGIRLPTVTVVRKTVCMIEIDAFINLFSGCLSLACGLRTNNQAKSKQA